MCVERASQSIMALENVLKVFGTPSTERTDYIFLKFALTSYILVLALKITLAYFDLKAAKYVD